MSAERLPGYLANREKSANVVQYEPHVPSDKDLLQSGELVPVWHPVYLGMHKASLEKSAHAQ